MYARENIRNGFWFSLGFGVAIIALTMGCFSLTEAGLGLLYKPEEQKGDTEMVENEEKMTLEEQCRAAVVGKLKPSVELMEQAIGTPWELDPQPDGTVKFKYTPEVEVSRRSDVELATIVTIVDKVIVEDLLTVPPRLSIHLPAIREMLKELQASRERTEKPCIGGDDFKEDCFALRAQLKETKYQTMLIFHKHPIFENDPNVPPMANATTLPVSWLGEMKANLMLAYRHLEDARMRLGKAIQAHDGGKSCYKR